MFLNNTVEYARKLKPEIPLVGDYGIPIRDEIELTKQIGEGVAKREKPNIN